MSRSSTTGRPDLHRTPTERYERLLDVQSLMARVSREIGPALDLGQVLGTVLDAMRSLVDFEGGLVSLLEEGHLVTAAVDPPLAEGLALPPRLPAGSGIAGRVIATGLSEISDDVRTDPRVTAENRDLAVTLDIASFLCVPLVCLGDIIGAIQVHSTRPAAFNDEDRVMLEGLATQVAGAVESARRYEMISQLEVLKSDFIARVSHELRTPITIMSGFVSTLLTSHERLDVDTRRLMLERVDVATARLSGLIDELLMLSRLEAGVVAANVEAVAATTVLENVRRQSGAPDEVTIDTPPDLLLNTDAALLVRALGFLVDNAIKYAGSCHIVARPGVIEVVDRGPGIPEEHRSSIFERFTRANIDTTVAGMGIGLPMARTLLAAAGADLAISQPPDGIGTRMVVRFW